MPNQMIILSRTGCVHSPTGPFGIRYLLWKKSKKFYSETTCLNFQSSQTLFTIGNISSRSVTFKSYILVKPVQPPESLLLSPQQCGTCLPHSFGKYHRSWSVACVHVSACVCVCVPQHICRNAKIIKCILTYTIYVFICIYFYLYTYNYYYVLIYC